MAMSVGFRFNNTAYVTEWCRTSRRSWENAATLVYHEAPEKLH